MRSYPKWLSDAVFYEIYPQSFYDTNGDGIGDLPGITEKLDYIKSLGCNAIWLNPCFDSPFMDAGYDVRDFRKIAPRYGTNEDAYRLFEEAHKRGMYVLLDLVAGHSSEEHEWFQKSSQPYVNEYTDRYIWTDYCFDNGDGLPYVAGESGRSATYLINFYKCQPALNYGFLHPRKPWQQPVTAEGPRATVQALKDIMRFWLDHGCDGFRVDMASSLVKFDDEEKSGTGAIWQEIRKEMDEDYPNAVLLSEWNEPGQALKYGFHMDFCLNGVGNCYSYLTRDYWNGAAAYIENNRTRQKEGYCRGMLEDAMWDSDIEDHTYFRKDVSSDITRFTNVYREKYEESREYGFWCLVTCNHDTQRMSWKLSDDELKIAYAMIFTMPGVPFLYYGDEIGMKYLDVPTKEGGYYRTGSRTPMQWNKGKNLGFSDADASELYLPVDASEDAPDVESQQKDPDSLLNLVKKIVEFRRSHKELHAEAPFEILYADAENPVFVYRRSDFVIAVNPKAQRCEAPVSVNGEIVFKIGNAAAEPDRLVVEPQSFVVFRTA